MRDMLGNCVKHWHALPALAAKLLADEAVLQFVPSLPPTVARTPKRYGRGLLRTAYR